MKASVIFTATGQRVIKNVEGSFRRYFLAYSEQSEEVEVTALTEEDKEHIVKTIISDHLGIDINIGPISKEQFHNFELLYWKQITYGNLLPEYAADGSGEFNYGICKLIYPQQ